MKTKDLIKLLQDADPAGEEQCCIGNSDIWDITVEPAYYDGCLQIIERDQVNRPIRGHRIRTGVKISLSPISIYDAMDYDDFVMEYADEDERARYEKRDLEYRRQDKEISFQVEQNIFCDWVFQKIQSVKTIPLGWVERIKEAGAKFYQEHRGPDVDGKMIESWPWEGHSYSDRLQALWEEVIHVEWDNYSRILIEYRKIPNE